MFRSVAIIFAATVLTLGSAIAAPLEGEKTYDMLFRNGTLDEIDRSAALVYRREVTNVLKPEAEVRDTGHVKLSFQQEDNSMAKLEFRQEDKHRSLGIFPASVGNPMIMYFYETVVRDMAEAAGGSPYYIRNRVKEALVDASDVEQGEAFLDGKSVPTHTIRMYPFKADPNAHRMQGFGDLELRVTMSDAVPGWYMSLVAEAAEGKVYRSEVSFTHLDDAQ
ncbi:MAG: hypothetical protein ABJL72_05405 [Roseobacter sp.]